MKKKELDTKSPKLKRKTRAKKAGGEKTHYVDAKRFASLIVQYYKDGIIGDELAMCISKIATKMSFAPNFINYSYREEMVGDALEKCFQALKAKKYEESRGNAFSYYSIICWHAFLNRIKSEKREHEAIQEYKDEVYQELVNSNIIDMTDNSEGDTYND